MAIDVVDLLAFFTSLLNYASNSCFGKFDDYNFTVLKNFYSFFFQDFTRFGAVPDLTMLKQSRLGMDPVFFSDSNRFRIPLYMDLANSGTNLIGHY